MGTVPKLAQLKAGRKYQLLSLIAEYGVSPIVVTKGELIHQWAGRYGHMDAMSFDYNLKSLLVTGLIERLGWGQYRISPNGLKACSDIKEAGVWVNSEWSDCVCKKCGNEMKLRIEKGRGYFQDCDCGNLEWFK
jgi:hypothetical protein